MNNENEIDITKWIPQKDFNEMWNIIDWVIHSHAKSDEYIDDWIFPKSYFRKNRTELAKLIKSNHKEYELKIVYKKINKESK
tara:strand:- start:420 stop:665 length:246 start_codon:yes stop_codon:yes gene_type:complete